MIETKAKLNSSPRRVPSTTIVPFGGFLIRNLINIQKKYPEIVRVRMGASRFYLVTEPSLVQEVLVTKQKSFMKGEFLQRTKKVFGEGLLTSEGEFHHSQRQLIQPAFRHDRIARYADTVTSYTWQWTENWVDGSVVDVHRETQKLTMSIVAKCLFGAEIEKQSSQIAEDLSAAIEYFSRLSSPLSPLLTRLPSEKKYRNALQRVDHAINKMIEVRHSSSAEEDLLSVLTAAKDEHGVPMSDKQVRDEVLILFTAGHETTANALTWTWYLLSQNTEARRRLEEEVDSIADADTPIGYEQIPRLEYTAKVFEESLRLYPPAWVLVRKATEQCTIAGYPLPNGANIMLSQYLNHHNPKYFTDPEEFKPERWTKQMRESLPRYAYFPFGGGARSCIGEPFARMEAVLVLANISSRWRMSHVEGHKVEMLPRITLRPRYGMLMKLERRR
ncbi:MAG: cytochrome P450 [Thermoprotei archaeon]